MNITDKHDPQAWKLEDDALPRRRLWLISVVAVVVVVLAVFGANAIRVSAGGVRSPPGASMPARTAPDQMGIVEQTLVRDTRRGLDERLRQKETLRHFGWADRAHGIATIPIEEAMQLVLDPVFKSRAFGRETGPAHAASRGEP